MRFKRELHFLFVVITADSPIGVKTAMTRVLDIIASSYPAEYNQILYMWKISKLYKTPILFIQ